MSRSLGGLMAAAATASTPVPRMTTGGRSVMPTRSLFPIASRHSRTHTARTSVVRSGVRATTVIGGVRGGLRPPRRLPRRCAGTRPRAVRAPPPPAAPPPPGGASPPGRRGGRGWGGGPGGASPPLDDFLDDAQVHVLEPCAPLGHVRDLGPALDERAHQQRVRAQRIGGGD